MLFKAARHQFHDVMKARVLRIEKGVLSNADKGNQASKAIALGIAKLIGLNTPGEKLKGQTAGNEFEIATALFIRSKTAFPRLVDCCLASRASKRTPAPIRRPS